MAETKEKPSFHLTMTEVENNVNDHMIKVRPTRELKIDDGLLTMGHIPQAHVLFRMPK